MDVSGDLVIYSGRSEPLIQPVIDAFKTKYPNVNVLLKAGSNSELANALIEEQANPQADVFITTELFTVQSLAGQGIFQSYLPKGVFSRDPLMPEVMDGVADPRVRHPGVLVYFIEQDGNQTGLPVVTMDDLRVFISFEHEFQCCAAEECKTRDIVVVSVKQSAVEEIVLRMRINEEAFQVVGKSKINVAGNLPVVIGNQQVPVALRESADPVVTHAVILGEDDLDGVSPDRHLLG